MKPRTTLRRALADQKLLGGVLDGPSWLAWRSLLIAAMGEKLSPEERTIFTELTQRPHEPGRPVEELVCVIGRRGGKSRAISVLAAYIAGLCTHPSLAPGEQGVVLVVSPDQRQAAICLNYINANFDRSPLLAQLIRNRTQKSLNLKNKVSVVVRSSDFKRIRGSTFL